MAGRHIREARGARLRVPDRRHPTFELPEIVVHLPVRQPPDTKSTRNSTLSPGSAMNFAILNGMLLRAAARAFCPMFQSSAAVPAARRSHAWYYKSCNIYGYEWGGRPCSA